MTKEEAEIVLYLGNFPFDTRRQDMMNLFRPFGQINCLYMRQKNDRFCGNALVYYAKLEDGIRACKELHQTLFHGNRIVVEESKQSCLKRNVPLPERPKQQRRDISPRRRYDSDREHNDDYWEDHAERSPSPRKKHNDIKDSKQNEDNNLKMPSFPVFTPEMMRQYMMQFQMMNPMAAMYQPMMQQSDNSQMGFFPFDPRYFQLAANMNKDAFNGFQMPNINNNDDLRNNNNRHDRRDIN